VAKRRKNLYISANALSYFKAGGGANCRGGQGKRESGVGIGRDGNIGNCYCFGNQKYI
tara:strand:- start:2538 stop:2711 length:174 start_codon:yes stop_codon:yes gene_type:complete